MRHYTYKLMKIPVGSHLYQVTLSGKTEYGITTKDALNDLLKTEIKVNFVILGQYIKQTAID